MFEYEAIDFPKLVDFMDKNRDSYFSTKFYENKTINGKIEICRYSIYDSYPIHFDILIRNYGLINFRLENYLKCFCYIENIHSQTEELGIGTILFDIMYDSMRCQSDKLGLKLEEIAGILSEKYHESGDWLKSIPFYIKQAYKRNLFIQFKFKNNIIVVSKETHPQYFNKEDAKIFAETLMGLTKNIAFVIFINRTSDLVCNQ